VRPVPEPGVPNPNTPPDRGPVSPVGTGEGSALHRVDRRAYLRPPSVRIAGSSVDPVRRFESLTREIHRATDSRELHSPRPGVVDSAGRGRGCARRIQGSEPSRRHLNRRPAPAGLDAGPAFRRQTVDGVPDFAYSTAMRIETDDLPFPSRDGDPVAMIRLTGELTTKARRTRARFQRRLARNIRASFAASGQACELRESWSRLLVHLEPGGSFDPLTRVFGVSSFSVLDGMCGVQIDEIVQLGTALYADQVRGRRFAIRARRSGTHPFSSMDIAVQLGSALNEGATVDLKNPDVEVHVEVRGDRTYFFSSRSTGAGGLPLRVEGRAVSLLSGGFDSPVASWMMLRRGVALDYVFCNLGGEAYRRMVLEVAKLLAERWSHGTSPVVHIVDFEPVVEELKRVVRPALLQVALKRQMYRVANRIAGRVRADAIVTGEAVGQVSSQTLANLRAIDNVSRLPVLRPLVGMDKDEIIDLSRKIGTYALSARVQEHCAITDERPATASRSRTLDAAEVDLDPELLRALTDEAERVDIRALDLVELAGRSLFVDQDIPGSTRVDMRPADAREAVPWSGAMIRSYDDLARGFKEFEPTRPVVLMCAQGLLSAQIAERMQEAGFEAYSLRGGERSLRHELKLPHVASTESKEHES